MTRLSYLSIAIATLLAGSALTAHAEDHEKGKDGWKRLSPAERFQKNDTNKDGFLTPAEMLAEHEARIKEIFTRLDTDKDGKLSQDEMKKGREDRREKREDRRDERREKMKEHHMDGHDAPESH